MTQKSFDCLIIGAGPAGYVAAIRASQLGKKVAVIDKHKTLGGTCLNIGCIPSKVLLDTSYKYWQATHQFSTIGLEAEGLQFDISRIMANKRTVIDDLTKGIGHLFHKHDITHIHGTARFIDAHTVEVTNDGQSINITAESIIIATGSIPQSIPHVAY